MCYRSKISGLGFGALLCTTLTGLAQAQESPWPAPESALRRLDIQCPTDRSVCAVSQNSIPMMRVAFIDPKVGYTGGSTGADVARAEADENFPAYSETEVIYVTSGDVVDCYEPSSSYDRVAPRYCALFTLHREDGQPFLEGHIGYAIGADLPDSFVLATGVKPTSVKLTVLYAQDVASSGESLGIAVSTPAFGDDANVVKSRADVPWPVVGRIAGLNTIGGPVKLSFEYNDTLHEQFGFAGLSAFAIIAATK
jgi:hypothetical protein